MSFNENIITKATALALIGSSSYILGISICIKKKITSHVILKRGYKKSQYLLSFFVYFIFTIILYFAGVGSVEWSLWLTKCDTYWATGYLSSSHRTDLYFSY